MAELARLQRDMLRGGASRATLVQMERLCGAAPDAADPALLDLLAGIVLRARVELARHDAFRPSMESLRQMMKIRQ